jgi:hypothetical protein
MEPAQQAIGDGLGQELARGQVFREAGVIGRGEIELVAQAVAARSQPHRPFGGDVDAVGLEALQRRDAGIRLVGQADFGIGRAGEGTEVARRQQQHFVAQCAQATHGGAQGVDDAVDLRFASVADDGNAHKSYQ